MNTTNASALLVQSATPSGYLGYCSCYLVIDKRPVSDVVPLAASVSKNQNAGGNKPTTVIWKMRNGGGD